MTTSGPKRNARRQRMGEVFTWLCAGALALNLLFTFALIGLIAVNGLAYFWPKRVTLLTLRDGGRVLGEIQETETIPGTSGATRARLKVGNRDVTGADFVWIDDGDVAERAWPEDAVLLERLEWGNFYGFPVELRSDDRVLATGPQAVLEALAPIHAAKVRRREAIGDLERSEIGRINLEIERLRLAQRRLDRSDLDSDERARRTGDLATEAAVRKQEYEALAERLFDMRRELADGTLVMRTATGARKEVAVGDIVRIVRPNTLRTVDSLSLFASRVWEFLSDDPRESNTEGGIFPAIFGTVMMVFILSFVVAPLGVLAALYLREYATDGPFVQLVRIAVNNLAGVPSIVFGVFGLGFFVYLIGGTIDRIFFPESLPAPTFGTGGILWASLTLALLTVPVVIVATEEGLAAVPRNVREGSLALGATKFETTWRVVLPAAAPGIMTGLILAMARAAGEVAPLMIVGMVKLAPTLPIDGTFPFLHLERKFMHLGFHIYDVGFQSPNVEAAEPLVFATALLLVLVVSSLNLGAIVLRNRLRAKYSTSPV